MRSDIRSAACLILATVTMTWLAACQSSRKVDASAANAVNRSCPVMDHPVDNSSPTVVYKGQVVSFCCADCIPEWEKMSKADAENAKKQLEAAGGAVELK